MSVTLDDPSGMLAPGPVDVSVFDNQMGYSASWARKSMGVTTADSPYVAAIGGTGAAMFFDPPRPRQIALSIAVPRLDSAGYFFVVLEPGARSSGDVLAAFTPYGEYFPPPGAPTASAHYVATPAPKGWSIALQLRIPPVWRPPPAR